MKNENTLKMSVKKILIILCICSRPLLGHADQTTFSFLEGTTLNFGIAIKQLDFDVSDSDESDFNGTLTEGMYTTFFLSLGSPYRYFSESSNFGFYFEFGLSNFKMDSQEVGSDEVDLGTSARGNYIYITPLVFYNFGDKNPKKHSLKLGLGVGIGYLKSEGDIVFTDDPSLPKHKFDEYIS
jgi:hypothetical protein